MSGEQPFRARRHDDGIVEVMGSVMAFLELDRALNAMDPSGRPGWVARADVAAQPIATKLATAIEECLFADDHGVDAQFVVVDPASARGAGEFVQRLRAAAARPLCEGLRDLDRWGRYDLLTESAPSGELLPNQPTQGLWGLFVSNEAGDYLE